MKTGISSMVLPGMSPVNQKTGTMTALEIQKIAEIVEASLKEKYYLIEKRASIDLSSNSHTATLSAEKHFIETCIVEVAMYFGMERDTLVKGTRKIQGMSYTMPQLRGMVVMLCRDLPKDSIIFELIASAFHKDHATVIHYYGKTQWENMNYKGHKKDYDRIKSAVVSAMQRSNNKIIELKA